MSSLSTLTPILRKAPAVALSCLILLAGAAQLSAQNRKLPCQGGAGGSSRISDEVAVVYTTKYDILGSKLESIMIARGPAGWQQWSDTVPDNFKRLAAALKGGGGTVGTIMYTYVAETDTAWIAYQYGVNPNEIHFGSIPVRLGEANAVLVEMTSADAGPRIVGTTRVEIGLPRDPGTCGLEFNEQTWEAFHAGLRAVLDSSPEVRAFMRP